MPLPISYIVEIQNDLATITVSVPAVRQNERLFCSCRDVQDYFVANYKEQYSIMEIVQGGNTLGAGQSGKFIFRIKDLSVKQPEILPEVKLPKSKSDFKKKYT